MEWRRFRSAWANNVDIGGMVRILRAGAGFGLRYLSMCLLSLFALLPAPPAGAGEAGDRDAALAPLASVTRESAPSAAAEDDAAAEKALSVAIERNPGDMAALERLAMLYLRRGDFRKADMTFASLLKLTLDDPARAARYAMGMWHVRQEYEAQSGMIRAMQAKGATGGNVRLLQRVLDDIYDIKNISQVVERAFPGPASRDSVRNFEKFWNDAADRIAALEKDGDRNALERYATGLFGGDAASRGFLAVWRGFALAYQGDLDASERELGIAADVTEPRRLKMDVAAGSYLVRSMRRDPLSNDVLNSLSEMFTDVSDSVEGRLSEKYVSLDERFKQAGDLNRERKFGEASTSLDEIRPFLTDDGKRTRYIYLCAETRWGLEEYDRANQGYVASSTLLKERFAISASLYRMAEYAVMRDRRDEAASYAVRSAGILREQDWKLRQVGNFFVGLDMPERGIAYLERSLDASKSVAGDADSYSALARAYKRIGDREQYLKYAGEYVEAIKTVMKAGNDVTVDQEGTRYYYEGEILAAQGLRGEAYAAYRTASEIVEERFRLSEILMIMADYQEAAGAVDEAEALAGRSADLLPEQAWKHRQAGALMLRIGRTAKGVRYLENALEHSHSIQDRAASYSALADAYKSLRNLPKSVDYAREYIALVKAHREVLTDAEEGLAAFYQGEIHAYEGEAGLAYPEYEKASRLLDNRFKRAEALMKMAEYRASLGDVEEAAELAEASADEIPEQGWKHQQVGDFFLRLDMPDKALEQYRRMVRLGSPDNDVAAYSAMAEAYRKMNRPDQYARYAREYIAATTADGRRPTAAEEGLAAYYEGEIHSLAGEADQAYAAYERAAALIRDKRQLSEALLKMAEYRFSRGDKEQAVELAERAAAELPVADTMRRAGDVILRAGDPDRAFRFFEEFAKQASASGGKANVHAAMAETYRKLGDQEKYLYFAREYVAAVGAPGYVPDGTEKGLAAYFRGELAEAADKPDEAYAAYEEAAGLLTDKSRLSDIFTRMARFQADKGDRERAAELAERSAEALPEAAWKMRQTGDFLLRLGMPERAFPYFERYAAGQASSAGALAPYSTMAETYKKLGDQEKYLHFAGEYAAKAEAAESLPPAEEGLAAFYRGEIHAAGKEPEQALAAYEKAAGLLPDRSRQAEALYKMAGIQADLGDKEKALELMERSAALLPNEDWKQRQLMDMYARLGMPERAVALHERNVRSADTPKRKAAAYAALAELHKKNGDTDGYLDNAGAYADLVRSNGFSPTRDEEGLAAYYQGEVFAAENRRDDAFAAYEQASGLVADKHRLSDILMKMATIEADRDNRDRAADLAERSTALLPEEGWKIQQAAAFFTRLGLPERAVGLYERQLQLADTPRKKATAMAALAELHKKLENDGEYLRYAREYAGQIASVGADATKAEQGLAAFFRGEILVADKDADGAYNAYEAAAGLLADNKHRQADALMKMATIEAERGNRDQAAALAERSAALLPEEEWKRQQLIAFYLKLEMSDKVAAAYEKRLREADTPKKKADALTALAELYKKLDDKERYGRYAREFVQLVGSDGYSPTRAEQGLAAYYRADGLAAKEDVDGSYAAYREAAGLLDDKYRRADALMKMANIDAERGERERAVALAEESAALLPGEDWKRQQLIGFYSRLEMHDKVVAGYEEQLRRADTPKKKLAAIVELAKVHKKLEDNEGYVRYAGMYGEVVASDGFVPDANERGLRHFYNGEIHTVRKRPEEAYREYEKASELFTDKFRLAETLMNMAVIRADQERPDEAAVLARRSAELLPEESWKLMETARFFDRLEMIDASIEYYLRRLALATTPKDKAAAYTALAGAYKKKKDDDGYIRYAKEYVAAIGTKGYDATKDERGLAHFYGGELHAADKRVAPAVAEYEQALTLLTDKFRISETCMKIARLEAERGDKDKAVRLAERAFAVLSDQSWKAMEVGYFFNGQDMTDKAIDYFRRGLGLSTDDKGRAGAYTALAEAHRKLKDMEQFGRYAGKYVEATFSRGGKASRDDRGLAFSYLGELQQERKDEDGAYSSFETAMNLYENASRRADMAMKLANYYAKREMPDEAEHFADKAAEMQRDNAGRQRSVGSFFSDQERMDKAFFYYCRVLDMAKNDKELAEAYHTFGGAYKKMKDDDKYIEYSRKYVDAIWRRGAEATEAERGLQAFYLGEIYTAAGDGRQAYAAYDYATQFVKDDYRLAEIYLNLAKHNVQEGDKDLAAVQARKAADALPDKSWRVTQAADILSGLKRYDEAEAILCRAIELNPTDNTVLYRNLSRLYESAKDKKRAIVASETLIDHLTERLVEEGTKAKLDKFQELWNARSRHKGLARPTGFKVELNMFGKKSRNGSHYLGMVNELYHDFRFTDIFRGKVYLLFGGTLSSKYSGTYMLGNELREWVSRATLDRTSQLTTGVSLSPFPKGKLSSLSFKFEYVFGTGTTVDDDVRARITYDRSKGNELRPYGRYWHYWKTYSNTTYSFEKGDITSSGYLRQGMTFTMPFDKKLLVIPYATASYEFTGKNTSGSRWGFDAGGGVIFRRFLGGGKYQTPPMDVEMSVYYMWGLTSNRVDGMGFGFSTKF